MPYTTLSLGLTLTIPTNGTTNWGTTLKNTTWTKISEHDHTGSGNGTKIGSTALEDGAVTNGKLGNNVGFKQQASTLTPAGTTQTIDWSLGQIVKLDLSSASGDVTLSLSNPVQGAYYIILVTQAASPLDLIYPAAVKWPQSQKPILSQTAGSIDKIFMYYDGASYYSDWDLGYA